MGEMCSTPGGPAALSHLASVPIIPLVSYRINPFEHEVHIYPPLPEPESSSRSERIELVTGEANRILEEMIKKHPEQWLWLHRRWKS
jgi:KDO2-lipid IV(A) lauroyltransferase